MEGLPVFRRIRCWVRTRLCSQTLIGDSRAGAETPPRTKQKAIAAFRERFETVEWPCLSTIRIRLGHESLDVTLAYLKGKDAESEEAQEHANSSSLALYA
jgi:hypothetical protein